jgi:hypothetical protein
MGRWNNSVAAPLSGGWVAELGALGASVLTMKRTIISVILLGALCNTGLCTILSFIESPQDDLKVLGSCDYICEHAELQPLLSEYNELLAVRIYPLNNLTNIVACFGAKLDQRPDDRAKPLFVPMMISESGLTPSGQPDKRHVEFYAIGDVGYLEAHYGFDGVWLAACAIHFRVGDEFVPLKSMADFSPRLEWDKTKFATLKKWFDEHLPKLTNLGVVEVSESSPSRIELGPDAACIINTRIIHHPNVTNLWYTIGLAKDTSDSGEMVKSMQYKSIVRQGQSVGFSIDGKYYRLTPKLVQQLQGTKQ